MTNAVDKTWDKLLKRDRAGQYPREELDLLVATAAPKMKAHWLAVLEDVAKNGKKAAFSSREEAGYACLLLGQLQVTEAFDSLIQLFKLPTSAVDAILGDFFTETLPWVIHRCSDGREAEMAQLLMNPKQRETLLGILHGSFTAKCLSGAYPREEYIRLTLAALDAHAAASSFHNVTELIWNWAELPEGFDRARAQSYFVQKKTDSMMGDWEDLVELVLERESPKESDIVRLVQDSLHDRTRVWSTRASEFAQANRGFKEKTEGPDERGRLTSELYRPFVGMAPVGPVTQALFDFLGFYSKNSYLTQERLNVPQFLAYSLGLGLSPDPRPFVTIFKHIEPMIRPLSPQEQKRVLELAQKYWIILSDIKEFPMAAFSKAYRLDQCSGMGTLMTLGRFLPYLEAFADGLEEGKFFQTPVVAARVADRVNWLLDRIEELDSFAEEYEKLHAKRKRRFWDSPPTESEIELIQRVQASLLAFHEEWPKRYQGILEALVENKKFHVDRFQAPKPFPFGRAPGPLRGAPGPLAHTDNVVPFRREGPKVGRNDPCPCGSGRKLKQCCG